MDSTYFAFGAVGLIFLIMIFTVVMVHFSETRKLQERLSKKGASPRDLALMEHITEEQEMTRQHISAQIQTKSNDAGTTKGMVIEIRNLLLELIKTIKDFIASVGK